MAEVRAYHDMRRLTSHPAPQYLVCHDVDGGRKNVDIAGNALFRAEKVWRDRLQALLDPVGNGIEQLIHKIAARLERAVRRRLRNIALCVRLQRMCVGIDRDNNLGSHRAARRHGHRVGHAAVEQPLSVQLHRADNTGQSDGRPHRIDDRALIQPHLAAGMQIARDCHERLLEALYGRVLLDCVEEGDNALAFDQAAACQVDIEEAGHFAPVHAVGPLLQRVQLARDVGRSHERAHGAAGHDIRFDAFFREGTQGADVTPSARPAAAQRDADLGFLHRPLPPGPRAISAARPIPGTARTNSPPHGMPRRASNPFLPRHRAPRQSRPPGLPAPRPVSRFPRSKACGNRARPAYRL